VLERIKNKKITSNLFNMGLYTKNLEKIFQQPFSKKILGEQKAHIL
jgi:predicted O-linked N-acetylglucosamine transferase (SPINDLY family)